MIDALVAEVTSPATLSTRRVEAAVALREAAEADETVGARLSAGHVVAGLWKVAMGDSENPNLAHVMAATSHENTNELVLPGVLGALAEIALVRRGNTSPSLVAQQLAALDTVSAIVTLASRDQAPSHRASPERAALVAAMRWLSAISTHPVTAHLARRDVLALARRSLEMRTDNEILLHTCVLIANCAADHRDLAARVCAERIPRLLTRLVLEPHAAAEVKEHAVLAVDRIAFRLCADDDSASSSWEQKPLPLALAALARCSDVACWPEGVWGLHLLAVSSSSSKSHNAENTDDVPAKLARLDPVLDVLRDRASSTTSKDDPPDVALARRVAGLTLADLEKIKSS